MSNPLNFKYGGAKRLVEEVTAQRLNAMLDEIRRVRPLSGHGISVRQEAHGVRIDALGRGVAGAGRAVRAWDIVSSKVPEAEDDQWTLRVRPGTLAQVLPTNWDENFSASGRDTLYYGIATAQTDGRAVVGVTISVDTTPPTPPASLKYAIPSEVGFVFGLFRGGKSYNLTNGVDIDVAAVATLATSAAPPAQPGESPYDIYFRLQ
jgi:hypothetical protein